MKKIVFVHHSSAIGGGSYCLLNILKILDLSLFEPVVLLKEDGKLVQEIDKLNIPVIFCRQLRAVPYNRTLFSVKSIWTYLSILLSFFAFRKKLKELSPDVVYLNNVMLYPYLWVSKKYDRKTVIHIREHWPMDEHKMQLKCLQCIVQKCADSIVAINGYSAQMVPGVDFKTSIVYDWIDFSDRYVEHDVNEWFGEDLSNKKIFLYTGGLNGVKGTLEVVNAFRKIKGEEYRLLMLGLDDIHRKGDFKEIIKRILCFLGKKNYSSRVYDGIRSDKRIVIKPAVYEIKDIIQKSYCVLSFFSIPHANLVLAESIILHTPVIAAKTAESLEYSDGGRLAILFEFGNQEDFFSKISEFIDNGCLNDDLYNEHTFTEQLFEKERNTRLLMSVLRTV